MVRRFRDRWLTSADPSQDEYWFPEHCDRPEAVYSSPWELIDRLLAAPEQPYAVYWHDRSEPVQPALFFTTDGGLIATLALAITDPHVAGNTLRQLAESVDADYGYVLWEEPPPDTASEFKATARASLGWEEWIPPILPARS